MMNKNTNVIEMVLFKVKPDINKTEAKEVLLILNDCVKGYPGFIKRKLSVSEDNQWLDLVFWDNLTSAKEAAEKIMKDEKATDVFSIIDQNNMLFKHFYIINEFENDNK